MILADKNPLHHSAVRIGLWVMTHVDQINLISISKFGAHDGLGCAFQFLDFGSPVTANGTKVNEKLHHCSGDVVVLISALAISIFNFQVPCGTVRSLEYIKDIGLLANNATMVLVNLIFVNLEQLVDFLIKTVGVGTPQYARNSVLSRSS
jgi:hypothetical protein